LLSNCYQPEQLKTSHICEISHYILRPVIIHSSWQYHSNIGRCRSNGNISSVETQCLDKALSHFHCSELNRIRNKIRAKAYTNSSQNSSDARSNDKANDT